MTAGARVTILYEDERGPTKGFGLHALVRRCVFDRVNGERHRIEQAIDGIPKKGDSKLLAACRADVADLARGGGTVIAVFDADGVRRLLQLPPRATIAEVEGAIKQGCSAPAALSVVLLDRNMESVLRAAAACDPNLDREEVRRAIDEKSRLARDNILMAASREQQRPVRDCILAKMPSLRALVERVCQGLQP